MSVGGLTCGASGFILQLSGQLPLFGFQALAHAVPLPTTFFPRVPLPWSSQPHPPLNGLAPRPPAPFRSIGPSLTTTLCIHGLQLGPDPISSGLQPTQPLPLSTPPTPVHIRPQQQWPEGSQEHVSQVTSLPESRSLKSSLPQSLPVPRSTHPLSCSLIAGPEHFKFLYQCDLGQLTQPLYTSPSAQ